MWDTVGCCGLVADMYIICKWVSEAPFCSACVSNPKVKNFLELMTEIVISNPYFLTRKWLKCSKCLILE